MATATVTLRYKADPTVWVEADVTLRPARITRVESRLGTAPPALCLPDGSAHPSYSPAEATLHSGALYALGRLGAIHGPASEGDPRYVLSVDRLAGVYWPENVEGFAVIGVVAVAEVTGRPDLATEQTLRDWEVAGCTVSG
jgi:hypothetical protein